MSRPPKLRMSRLLQRDMYQMLEEILFRIEDSHGDAGFYPYPPEQIVTLLRKVNPELKGQTVKLVRGNPQWVKE